MEPNKTPPGKLGEYLIGDLGVAYRHLKRIRTGALRPVPAVLDEIERSVTTCIQRIERDLIAQAPAMLMLLRRIVASEQLGKTLDLEARAILRAVEEGAKDDDGRDRGAQG
jgi:hypothetical protein